jgi:Family of unknown function (DUF6288)
MKHNTATLILAICLPSLGTAEPSQGTGYYTEPPVYDLRPKSTGEFHFGHVGVTGLVLQGYPGVVLKVAETTPGTPADGKFRMGEIITGLNGVPLKGRNPFVILGEALTQAEAKDGKLVFDVSSEDGRQAKKVEVVIPILGAYSPTWPLDCEKSKAIINRMADYYSKNIDEKPKFFYRFAGHGSIAYGDYRPEGGICSNGKDGMAAVVMHLASGAQGDVNNYRQARDSFAVSMIDSYSGGMARPNSLLPSGSRSRRIPCRHEPTDLVV